ncbi:macro domain-containing protein [Actinoplanes sp. CA-142083]|uniref:macro domain-containing protein n=1 Tax=Actinoplanes sp. CA-142083 TaxID=3239903 RepID=UPI003D8EB435
MLGPAELIVRGEPWHLPPRSLAVLLRLAADAGEFVPVDRIYRDLWEESPRTIGRPERTQVQKAINDIRKAGPGHGEAFIETYRLGRTSSYRLVPVRDRIDFLRFGDLVEQARSSDATTAVELLRAASSLWRGSPMPEVAHLPFAEPIIRSLLALRAAADRELAQACVEVGRHEEALGLAEKLHTAAPDDPDLTAMVAELRRRRRSARRHLLRREVRGPQPFAVSVVVGDIFAETDAHLVVGFTDTFDTDTRSDIVINGRSLQAEAARRLFHGNRGLLDQKLQAALEGVEPQAREKRADKRRGKLKRYPMGTVAVLRADARQIYAVAYSRMGNDLVARSSERDLAVSLERLWDAVHLHGQLRPVAVPLIGAGLSRIASSRPDELVTMLIESFVVRNRSARISTELRVVLRPDDVTRIDLQALRARLGDHFPDR